MIFMVLSVVWGHIQERTRNFKHLVHETWPWTYRRIIFKFYKIQTKSKNYETCRDIMISYVEDVIKFWEGFAKLSRTMLANRRISEEVSWFREEADEVVSIVRDKLAQNLLNFFIIASTYDIMTSRQVSLFFDFVCIL